LHYNDLFSIRRLWIILAVSMVTMFGVLLYYGGEIYTQAPPIPGEVKTIDGVTIYTGDQIQRGQNVWQSLGGMQRGSIWGHGSYLAPDWSADWLHREALHTQYIYSRSRFGLTFEELTPERQAVVNALLRLDIKKNTWDPENDTVWITDDRASAIAATAEHYAGLFQGGGEEATELREAYAFSRTLTLSNEDMYALNAFFFWASWSAVTNRPGDTISYTSNWPHDQLVGNTPSASLFMWTIISIFLLLGGVGALVWFYAAQFDVWRDDMVPEDGTATENLLANVEPTPSMKATAKYFWTVIALIATQVGLGIITAHYAVEGQDLYGFPISDYLPYAVTRTWHTQIAVLWIATAWLAAGLYFAPLISGHEPRFQRFGVNFLYTCLLIIVVGSMAGEWLGINQFFSNFTMNFWFGHQGYEYVDLGRFWQIFLFVGLLVWLTMMVRALLPALRQGQNKSLLFLLLFASTAIGLLYGAGLTWGEHTHISIVEYWRWWVVHLWVEGVFEVFATTVIALVFVYMGILRRSTAAIMVLFATIIFLSGGVLGTFHHLYFSGTPISVLAIGGVFSALEVVPLVVIGFEAFNHARVERQAQWIDYYRWPLMFLAAVLFWNLVGAGLLGFLINPPLALYYMQGLNTTATHGHAALFGVYGMLGIGLMLFCLRGLTNPDHWRDEWLKWSFWSFNIGLFMMTFLSLLPQGLWQTYLSYTEGYWYARSAEVIHSPLMENLVWARVPGDLVFSFGVFALVMFAYRLYFPAPAPAPAREAQA
jgi:nitric oxide reductase subunit B